MQNYEKNALLLFVVVHDWVLQTMEFFSILLICKHKGIDGMYTLQNVPSRHHAL